MRTLVQSWRGRAAPPFRVRAGHATVSIEALGREPVVLAFLEGWSAEETSDEALDQLRGELRGLGAVLVVLAASGLYFFRPDDDLERCASAGDLDAEAVAKTRRAFGLDAAGEDAAGSALFVLDGDRVVRAVHAWPRSELVDLTVLTEALAIAGREVLRVSVSATAQAPASDTSTLSRRELVTTSLVAAFAFVFLDGCTRPEANGDGGGAPAGSSQTSAAEAIARGAGEVEITLNVNGASTKIRVDPRTSLLDTLRERMGLTGTKKGCDHGQCGACTVHVDGRRVKSCMLFAQMGEGKAVTTIEGLAKGDTLHPMQEAFIAEDGLQCGYCTPGQIMSAVALLTEGRAKTDAEVREQMSGNICRCGAYTNIVAAIQLARKRA